MESEVCVLCKTEQSNDNFYNKNRECKECNIKRSLKCYNENRDKISNQQKYIMKKKRKIIA